MGRNLGTGARDDSLTGKLPKGNHIVASLRSRILHLNAVFYATGSNIVRWPTVVQTSRPCLQVMFDGSKRHEGTPAKGKIEVIVNH
jgi:hypothetical protein